MFTFLLFLIRVSGNPILFNMNNLLLEVIIWKNDGKTDVLLGIVLRKARVDEIIYKLLKQKVDLAWIGDITAGNYFQISNLYL